jgi:hypothetical protein
MAANRANFETDASVGNHRRARRLNASLMRASRDVFPVKTAMHLSDITGYSTRACERWLSGQVVLPTDALASLIQSESGRDFLACVMADQTPRWWLTVKALFKRISLEAAEALQARRYKELLDDEASYARAYPAAPRFQDDSFYEGQPAPVRSMARRKR